MRERLREFLERESYAEARSTFFNDGNVVRHHNLGEKRLRSSSCASVKTGALKAAWALILLSCVVSFDVPRSGSQ